MTPSRRSSWVEIRPCDLKFARENLENRDALKYAEDWRETVIEPLQTMRDHLHWLARPGGGKPTVGWFERLVDTLLQMAYQYEGRLTRGEE